MRTRGKDRIPKGISIGDKLHPGMRQCRQATTPGRNSAHSGIVSLPAAFAFAKGVPTQHLLRATMMVELTQKDRAVLDDVIAGIYELGDLDDFAVAAMRELPRLVESDVTSFNEVNFKARRLIGVLDDPSCQKIYLQKRQDVDRLLLQNPLVGYTASSKAGAIKISDFMSDDEWRKTEFYRVFFREMDVNYQMSVSLNLGGNVVVAFALNRITDDFTERDRALLTAVQPHLIRAYRNAVKYTETLTQLHGREKMLDELGVGWIDLDDGLRIVRSSRSAITGITAFFPVQNLDAERLPPEVESWLEASEAADRAGESCATLVKLNGRDRLTLRRIADERSGAFSLMVERFIDNDSPEPLQQLGLTQRQTEVLYWVMQGKTNAEIAIILKLSRRTVENHVSAILEILGLENRTEAALAAAETLKAFQGLAGDPPPNLVS